MPGPLPRWLTGCSYPFLPLSRRPSPNGKWVGSTTIFRSTTSERGLLTRLQSFDNLQASEFACHPGRSHRWHPCGCQGSRGVYIRAECGSLPLRTSDMLAVRIGQLTAEVFHLLDLQPCWLLLPLCDMDQSVARPDEAQATGHPILGAVERYSVGWQVRSLYLRSTLPLPAFLIGNSEGWLGYAIRSVSSWCRSTPWQRGRRAEGRARS